MNDVEIISIAGREWGTLGVLVALALFVAKAVWPWVRDNYLATRIRLYEEDIKERRRMRQEEVDAAKRVAQLLAQFDIKLATLDDKIDKITLDVEMVVRKQSSMYEMIRDLFNRRQQARSPSKDPRDQP